MRKTKFLMAGLLVLALVATGLILALAGGESENRVRLADGSIFELKQVTLTATNFFYNHSSRGRVLDAVAPYLHAVILKRFPAGGGGFGFGGDGGTNLVIITALHHAGSNVSKPHRLRISDGTNVFDACWGAHTLGSPGQTINGWTVRAFPRRAKELRLEFLGLGPAAEAKQVWSVLAEFTIGNPVQGDFPRWERGPTVQTDGKLAVRLAEFRSGIPLDHRSFGSPPETIARGTRMFFAFEEEGQPTEDWRIQKVVISDATGNHWFPYLDLRREGLNWAKGGRAEFLGALWPGEAAWKIDVEAVRTSGFAAAELLSFTTELPAPGTRVDLTNEWEHAGMTVTFVSLASPNVEHPGDLRWVGKWWGEDKNEVYSMVLRVTPASKSHRLQLVSAVDENGKEAELVQHQGQDYSDQGIFLKPHADAKNLTFTFSLSPSRFVQFLAAPEVVPEPR